LYHSEGCNICGGLFCKCYVNDLHTTTCSGMLGHRTHALVVASKNKKKVTLLKCRIGLHKIMLDRVMYCQIFKTLEQTKSYVESVCFWFCVDIFGPNDVTCTIPTSWNINKIERLSVTHESTSTRSMETNTLHAHHMPKLDGRKMATSIVSRRCIQRHLILHLV
jgi:hypothetical protein